MNYSCKIAGRSSVTGRALSYILIGLGFETRRGERNVSIYLILPAATGPGV
jgi:hypothetical protein